MNRVVRDALIAHAGFAIEPVVADDSADRGNGTRQHGCMADGRDRRVVFEIRVREHGAVREQPLEALRVIAPEPRQIIVPKLVDGDEQHEFDVGGIRRRGRGQGRRKRDEC